MRTQAAVLSAPQTDWQVVEMDLDDPKDSEVVVKMKVAGICHSDKHVKAAGGGRFPLVGGHEGAGIVERVGSAVSAVKPGDHVALSWIPSCGKCQWCRRGLGNLCDLGALMHTGELAAGGFRFHRDGEDYSSTGGLGTFAERIVVAEHSVVKIDESIPWEWASLVTCGVATGWGSIVNAGKVTAGDTVAIYGVGGIGANAVLAAVAANAGLVAVVEPVEWKRKQALAWGADYAYATAEEAQEDLWSRTEGVGLDVTVLTAGEVHADLVGAAFLLTRKGGAMVLTGVTDDFAEISIQLSGSALTLFQKRLIGTLFGDCVPHVHVPLLLDLAMKGRIPLNELVTTRYTLDQVNQGFDDLLAGKNIRGIIVFED